eukprot:scaffold40051_cov23-Prasinocladus_malaysianus.AAC.8
MPGGTTSTDSFRLPMSLVTPEGSCVAVGRAQRHALLAEATEGTAFFSQNEMQNRLSLYMLLIAAG